MGELTTTGTRAAAAAEMERWGLTRDEAEAEFDKWLASVKAEAFVAGAESVYALEDFEQDMWARDQ